MGASLSSCERSLRLADCPENDTLQNRDPIGSFIRRVPSLRYLRRRRVSISGECGSPTVSGKHPVVPKSQDARETIAQIIKTFPLFADLDATQHERLVDSMVERRVSAGDVVIKEGDQGDFLYAIENGIFSAKKAGETIFVYNGSGSFGELALLYNAPRAATVVAETDGILWALDRLTFRSLVAGDWHERRKAQEALLRDMKLFKDLNDAQRAAIADCLCPVVFTKGSIIISQNDPITCTSQFYIVVEGLVDCFRNEIYKGARARRATRAVGPGGIFGEVSLLTNEPRQADCIAATDKVKCMALSRDAFERLMGPVENSLQRHIEEYRRMNAQQRRSTGP